MNKYLFSLRLLCAQGLCPAISQNHGLQTVARLRSLIATASANICYAPATAQGQHVLPDFTRSELQFSESEFMELEN